jgi:hypothetical protein
VSGAPPQGQERGDAALVQVRLRDGADLLARHAARDQRDELFAPEAVARPVGETVLMELAFAHSGYAFRLRGTVISRRLTGTDALPAGARVAVALEDRGLLRHMVLAHARGEAIEYRPRCAPRLLCRPPLRLTVRLAGGSRAGGQLVDLSPGGARIAGVPQPARGSELALRLSLPGRLFRLHLRGQVVWAGDAGGPFGVAFHFQRARQRRRVHELCEQLAARRR